MLVEDPPPRTHPVGRMRARLATSGDGFVTWNLLVVLSGARWERNRAGILIVGESLFGPASMIKMDSPGSASASLAAITQAAVPPIHA